MTSQKRQKTTLGVIIREILLEYFSFETEWKINLIEKTANVTSF